MIENAPIYGRQSKSEDVHDFKKRKMALKELGYPTKETKLFVKEYLEKVKDRFAPHLSKDSLLITVPSGSGKNLVTAYLAQALAKEYNCKLLPAGSIAKLHTLEAKHALGLEKRICDPISYTVNGEDVKKHIANGTKIFIVDDVIGTGESSVRLKMALNKENIPVTGLVSLITVEPRYPTPNDLKRLMDKIASHVPFKTKSKKEAFIKDTIAVFYRYTRQRVNRIERVIGSQKAAEKAFETITRAARFERTNIIPPLKKKISTAILQNLNINPSYQFGI